MLSNRNRDQNGFCVLSTDQSKIGSVKVGPA